MDFSRGVNWGPALFIIIYQLITIVSLPFYFYYAAPTLTMVVCLIVLMFINGISITGGYHRKFSHRAYRTNGWVDFILLFFGTMTAQGSVLRWAYDHRVHHAHVDTDQDPYSIKKGFWYAHCLWLLENPKPIQPKIVSDLIRDPLIMFQDRYYPLLMIAANALAFLAFGWLCNDYVGSFFLIVLLRLFLIHHFTWFINSLAHTWGDKPFSDEQSAVNNYIISFLTFGEGYHNYHHTYANDYRNGVRWYHFDPTKWTIWLLSKMGLAHDLKKMDSFTIKKRMVLEKKQVLLNQIKELWHDKKDELEKNVQDISERILLKISDFKALSQKYCQAKGTNEQRDLLRKLHGELKLLKKSIKADWRRLKKLSHHIMRLKPLNLASSAVH
ncbi:MAG: acyl-CoA desaturase [Waddliaceae bacterium]